MIYFVVAAFLLVFGIGHIYTYAKINILDKQNKTPTSKQPVSDRNKKDNDHIDSEMSTFHNIGLLILTAIWAYPVYKYLKKGMDTLMQKSRFSREHVHELPLEESPKKMSDSLGDPRLGDSCLGDSCLGDSRLGEGQPAPKKRNFSTS